MTPLFLRFNTSEVILSGFAGGEYLPLPASKGPAFPFLLTLDGYPTSPADYAQKQRNPLKNSGNSRIVFLDSNESDFIAGQTIVVDRGSVLLKGGKKAYGIGVVHTAPMIV